MPLFANIRRLFLAYETMVLSETGILWIHYVLLGYVGLVLVLFGQIVPSMADFTAL